MVALITQANQISRPSVPVAELHSGWDFQEKQLHKTVNVQEGHLSAGTDPMGCGLKDYDAISQSI